MFDASAPRWSWHPFDPPEDEFLWQLSEAEKDAVRRAVQAVVERDVATVRQLVPADAEDLADTLWSETDRDGDSVRLLMPPGPVDDWDGYVFRRPDDAEVGVEFLDADQPDQRTDLTLRMELRSDPAGHVAVELMDLHVL